MAPHRPARAPEVFQTFGELLTYLRKRARLTQEELGRAVGYSRAHIARLENNQRLPSQATVEALFGPALDLADAPELAQRLTELASAAHQPRTNLPAPVNALIGREADVAQVCGYLLEPDRRLVTLVGPPGIGKTRLALQAATDLLPDFADGVFFVALDPIADPALVAPAIVQTLGLMQSDQRSPVERLKHGINDRQMLIVLDNFEQVVEAAPLVLELLTGCPYLKLIVTSRESLRVPGEWLYAVPPLTVPDERQLKTLAGSDAQQFSALRLFAARARAVRSDFVMAPEDTPTMAAICRQLDGLPLAIELIAARVRLMPPQALLAHLTSAFTLRADGMRGTPLRQKTLHNAIAWSHALLSPDERVLLARLSVFAGGFTLGAAEAVSQIPNLTAGLTSLLDKSLLVRAAQPPDEARFSQLVMIRDFALDRLRERQEESALRDQHLAYFLELAEQADQAIHGPDQVDWIERCEKEFENFRAVLEWCVSQQNTPAALRLLGALGWLWVNQGQGSEVRSWFDKLQALPGLAAYPALYATVLNHVARHSWLAGDFRETRSVLQASQALWLKLGPDGERGLAATLNHLGNLTHYSDGDSRAARSFYERSLELFRKHSDRWGMAWVLYKLGSLAAEQRDETLALTLLEQSLALANQVGDAFNIARASQGLGLLFLDQGRLAEARRCFDRQLAKDERIHFKSGMAIALLNLGELSRYQGDFDLAEQFYEKATAVYRELYGGTAPWGQDFYVKGLLALHRGQYPQAAEHFIAGFRKIQGQAEKVGASDLLTGLAAVAGESNQPERAARLSGAAQGAIGPISVPYPPFDRAEFDRHIRIAREQLGEERFEALQGEGRRMTMEEAIAAALAPFPETKAWLG